MYASCLHFVSQSPSIAFVPDSLVSPDPETSASELYESGMRPAPRSGVAATVVMHEVVL